MKEIKKDKLKLLVILFASIALILVMSFAILKTSRNIEPEVVEEPKTLYIGYDDKVEENFTKKAAVDALDEIFVEVAKDVDGKSRTIDERLSAITADSLNIDDIFNKKVIDSIYFAEEFGSDEFNKKFTASSLLVYYQIINDPQAEDYVYNYDSFEEFIYIDNKFLTVHIPLDMYIGAATGIAFEMQYIEGEWKLNPYTALMSLRALGIQDVDTQQRGEEKEEE